MQFLPWTASFASELLWNNNWCAVWRGCSRWWWIFSTQQSINVILILWSTRIWPSLWCYIYFYCYFQEISSTVTLPSVLWHCWLGCRKGIWPVKNGMWRWALVSPDGVVPSRMVGVSASVNLPCIIKSRSSRLAPAHQGGPGKRAITV